MILIVTLSPRLAVVDGSLPLGGPPIRFGVADACGPGLPGFRLPGDRCGF